MSRETVQLETSDSRTSGLGLRILASRDVRIVTLILAFVLPVTLPALEAFYSFDDLQNLNYYLQDPWKSILSNLLLFTSHRRPAGALLYLPLYKIFGMNPLPLYITGLLLFHGNLILLYALVKRLTGRRPVAVITVGLSAFYAHVHNVLFNFGAVYELLAFTGLLLGLHSYLTFRATGQKKYYLLLLLSFWLALNAKETAVVLPALLACYELLYHRLASLLKGGKRLFPWHLPLWLIALCYTLAKTLGAEAMWRSNPAYQLQFDWTFWDNLVLYVYEIGYAEYQVDGWTVAVLLLAATALGLWMRSPHMLFGLAYALLTLLPVLLLPRVWGLFLYLPISGLALFLGAFADRVGVALWGLLERTVRNEKRLRRAVPFLARAKTLICLLLALAFLRSALVYSAPRVRYAREANYFATGRPWRSFARQLYTLYPTIEKESILAFRDAPFNPDTFDRWCLNFLVWLKFEDWDIQILRIPADTERLRRQLKGTVPVHYFVWKDGTLSEEKPENLH